MFIFIFIVFFPLLFYPLYSLPPLPTSLCPPQSPHIFRYFYVYQVRISLFFFKRFFFFYFLERGEGREKEKERNIDLREKHQWVAFPTCPGWGLNLQHRHVPGLGVNWWPFALQDTPNQLNHTDQGAFLYFMVYEKLF